MRHQLKKPWLYLISDRKAIEPRDLISFVQKAAQAGVDLIQIREKDLPARHLCHLVKQTVAVTACSGARVLVNDRFDVALACGAHGVHLTTQSLPPQVVRRHVGESFLIGVSAHSLEEVNRAQQGGADFVVLGPVFDTPSKRHYGPPLGLKQFAEIIRRTHIPILGIGGIELSNFPDVLACGASGIAAIRLFIQNPIEDVVRCISQLNVAWKERE